LFLATRADLAQQVLVKLIAGDGYGVAAHRKLAEADIAPALFGVATVEGAHTAYVMEYLSPKDGWTTLYEYAKKHGQDTISRIEGPVGRILRAMESEQIVHGDLRPNNIMVREIEDGLEMKVVDFDWAGTSGEVKYPFDRNMNISWPAEAGEPIVTEHDRWMVMNSLDKLAQ
jgi:serine/threonine protein kinase